MAAAVSIHISPVYPRYSRFLGNYSSPPEKPEAPAKGWERFDRSAAELVVGLIDFAEFCRTTTDDFLKLARIATRKRRPPPWVEVSDVVTLLQRHAWWYAFHHESSNTEFVGYDPGRGVSAGSYLRYNVARRVQKDLSLMRGEEQHRRDVKTATYEFEVGGEAADLKIGRAESSSSIEDDVDRRNETARLGAHCRNNREWILLAAHVGSWGDDRRAACAVLESAASRAEVGACSESEVIRAIGEVIDALEARRDQALKG